LDYCSKIMFMATNEALQKLQLLQNQEERRLVNFNTLVLVFKMKNGMVPNYMQDEMLFTRDATARTLRNADDFRLPRYQKTSTQNMIWHNGLRMFNALQPSVKQGRNLDGVKCQIFEIMREQFPV
jgi:hypothetical protein